MAVAWSSNGVFSHTPSRMVRFHGLAEAGLSRIDTYAIPRCESAVLLAEGRLGEARQALEEAKSRLSLIGKSGDALAEYDLVRDLEQQLTLRGGPGPEPGAARAAAR